MDMEQYPLLEQFRHTALIEDVGHETSTSPRAQPITPHGLFAPAQSSSSMGFSSTLVRLFLLQGGNEYSQMTHAVYPSRNGTHSLIHSSFVHLLP
jgi:hypothetical protein